MNPDTLLEDRMQRYLDGSLTPENAANLDLALTTDPAAAERFAELTRLESGLRDALREDSRAVLFRRRFESPEARPEAVRHPAGNWRRHAAIAAALAVAGGAGVALWHWIPAGHSALTESSPTDRRHRVITDAGPWSPAPRSLSTPEKPDSPAEMRRRLRSFFVPDAGVTSLPLSEALLALRRQWETLPHAEGATVPEFVVAESVSQQWKATGREPFVSLGVPGISLLTNLNLAAAQAGLQVEISETGATLESDPRPVPEGEKTWTFALGRNAVQRVSRISGTVSVDVSFALSDLKELSYDWLLSPPPDADSLTRFYEPSVPAVTVETTPSGSKGPDATVTASPEIVSLSGVFADSFSGSFQLAERESEAPSDVIPGEVISGYPVPPVPELALDGLLAAHGSAALETEWDESGEVLSLTGQVSELRKAEAVIQALKESAGAGVRVENRLISFAGLPPDSATVEELMSGSRGNLLASPQITCALGQSGGIFVGDFNEAGDTLSLNFSANRRGDQMTLELEIAQRRPTVAMDGEPLPPEHRGETVQEMNSKVTVNSGEWSRIPGFVDQDSKGRNIGMILLVRATPVTVDPPASDVPEPGIPFIAR